MIDHQTTEFTIGVLDRGLQVRVVDEPLDDLEFSLDSRVMQNSGTDFGDEKWRYALIDDQVFEDGYASSSSSIVNTAVK